MYIRRDQKQQSCYYGYIALRQTGEKNNLEKTQVQLFRFMTPRHTKFSLAKRPTGPKLLVKISSFKSKQTINLQANHKNLCVKVKVKSTLRNPFTFMINQIKLHAVC